MATPTGQISFADLRNEFGGSNPVKLGDYYRGGPRVPNVSANSNVPTSGQISMNQLKGASAYIAPTISGSSSQAMSFDARPGTSSQSVSPGWTVSNGGANRTYSWTKVSGGANSSASSTDTLNPSFSVSKTFPSKAMGTGTYSVTSDLWRLSFSDGTTSFTKDFTVNVSTEKYNIGL